MRILKRVLQVVMLILLGSVPALAQSSSTGNITAQSTNCATANSCVVLSVQTNPPAGGATFTLSGTFSGTLQFEASGDNQSTWVSISATPSSGGTAVTSATAPGTWQVNVAGYTAVRIRCSTYTSGTAVSTIQLSSASARAGGSSGGAPSGPAGGVLSGSYPNPAFASPPVSSDVFYATTACNGLANCVQWTDDDSTDNCGTATTAWVAAINATTPDSRNAMTEIHIIGSGTGKAFLLKTCTLAFTVSHDVTLQGTIDFGTTQTPANCIQEGPATLTSGYSTGGTSIIWRFHGGTLTGCTAATLAGMESMPWMGQGYLYDMNIRNFGPTGNTAGLCTKSAIKLDIIAEAHISGIKWDDQGTNSCFSANTQDCGSSVSCTGATTGQNTLHFSDSTITHANGGSCASVGHLEGGTHTTITNVSFWGEDVPLLLAAANGGGGGWMVVGNTIDSAGCSANSVSAAVQFGHNGSGQFQGPADIVGNDIPGGSGHSSNGLAIAGNSTDAIKGVTFTGNDAIANAIPVMPTNTACTPSGGQLCFVGQNAGFNLFNPGGGTATGWISAQGLGGGELGFVALTTQGANLGSTAVTPNLPTGFNLFSRANCVVAVTRAATSSSTMPSCTVTWTDSLSGVSESQTLTSTSTANTVGTISSGMVWMAPKAGTNVTITTSGFLTSGATSMQYSVFASVVAD